MKLLEIERKYLIKNDFKKYVVKSYRIKQGFLSIDPERTVRIRTYENKGFLTIKGKGSNNGTTRFEWEKEIPFNDAKQLLKLCKPSIIDKTRYIISIKDDLFFEVDEFYGDNKGLVIAEIELPTEDSLFNKPNWLGKEVTGEKKYYNSMLSQTPYNTWKKNE